MALIEINNFSQNFGDKILFEDANFTLNNNEKIGLVGLNGAGKSTLIKIIMGEVLLDKGSVYKNSKYKIKYLDQHAEVREQSNIKEYLAGAYKHLYDKERLFNQINEKLATETNQTKIDKLINQSGDLFEELCNEDFYSIDSNIGKVSSGLGVTAIGMDRQVSTLSGGQRAKVMLAKLLLEEPDVMILDEPTNFLDVSHIDWLTKFIVGSKKAFIVVSHDEHFVNDIVTHVCDVDNGKVVKYLGNIDKMRAVKEEKRTQLVKGYESQQKEIKKLEDYIAKNKARASTAKMAKSRERKLDKIEVITPPAEQITPTFTFKQKPYMGSVMLTVKDLHVGYNGHSLLKKDVSFEVMPGDRIAITGFNGIGKSTLLKTILNKLQPISGSIEYARNVAVGYYEQENNFHTFEGTPLNYIINKFPKLSEKEARTVLNKCGLTSLHVKKQVGLLSGGEQSKIKLCELSLTPTNLLILDEPTNHLDILAINYLESLLKTYNQAVIFVSHSKPFVKSLANKIIDLESMA